MKEYLYDWFVRKNGRVWYEYERYVREHIDEHHLHRLRHIRILLKLNWFYRVKKGSTPYLYWDIPLEPEKTKEMLTQQLTIDNVSKTSGIQNALNQGEGASEVSEYIQNKRPTAYSFAMGIRDYDIISFDIFDTLILRKLAEPEHIFMVVGEKLGIYDFFNMRKKAEKEVRDKNILLWGHRECKIDEIYEKISVWTGIDKNVGIQTEVETEIEYCEENPYMKQVFQIIKAMGKEIYATSNMYLGKDILTGMLIKCGYEGFKDILVSCDYNCSKATGALFEILKFKEPFKRIVHIGDNRATDINGAKIALIDSRLYPACRERGNGYRARGFSSLVGAAYYAQVNNRLHSGVVPKLNYSSFWEFGYLYGGLAALGYVNWIHKKAKQEGKELVVFLARDGAILKEIYDFLYDDIPCCYMLWSRIAGIRDISVGTRELILFRVIDENAGTGITIREALAMMGWEKSADIFESAHCIIDVPLCKENIHKVKELIVRNWRKIEEQTENMIVNEERYIYKCIGSCKNIALVDIGWTGKNSLKLKEIIKKNDDKMFISIYMLGVVTKVQNPYEIKNDSIQCYMFAADYNREIQDAFCKMSNMALDIVEKMFSTAACSFIGITETGKYKFAAPEIENYKVYKEISSGIIDFCIEYVENYGKTKEFMNISGYDSWVALGKALRNKELLERLFVSTVYNKGISVRAKRESTVEIIRN